MFIGGSPGSTAGGIKTSTLAVLLLYVHSNIRQTSVSYTHLDVYKRQPDGSFGPGALVLQLAGGFIIAVGLVLPGISVSQMLYMLGIYETVKMCIRDRG